MINKCDLDKAAESVAVLQGIYAGSVSVFPLSAATGAGLAPLLAFLGAGHRGAFVGTTGVGKSSLLNALCPEIDLKVGGAQSAQLQGVQHHHRFDPARTAGRRRTGRYPRISGFRPGGYHDARILPPIIRVLKKPIQCHMPLSQLPPPYASRAALSWNWSPRGGSCRNGMRPIWRF